MTEHIIHHDPAFVGGPERREMDHAKMAGPRGWRRRLVAGAAMGGAAIVAASAAWACTYRIGTLEVCVTPSSPSDCSSVTGTGSATGLTDIQDTGQSVLVRAKDFLPNVPYSITFRKPGAAGNCHRPTSDGGTVSLLGTNSNGFANTITADSNGKFSATATTPVTTSTGSAAVCTQDANAPILFHEVVTGNVLPVAII